MSTTLWSDETDRITPEELQVVSFPLTRLGRRGYDEEAVQEFLVLVHSEFVRLVNERAGLWQEVQRLRKRILAAEAEGEGSGVLFGEADAHVHAVRILSAAQVTADRYVSDAQAYSSRVTEEARLRRDDIVREAQQHSDMILEEAHSRAREAAVSALNAAPLSPKSDHQWQAAQAELAYLRTYGNVYRAHMRAYTEGVLRGIEDWERQEAASLQEAAHGQNGNGGQHGNGQYGNGGHNGQHGNGGQHGGGQHSSGQHRDGGQDGSGGQNVALDQPYSTYGQRGSYGQPDALGGGGSHGQHATLGQHADRRSIGW